MFDISCFRVVLLTVALRSPSLKTVRLRDGAQFEIEDADSFPKNCTRIFMFLRVSTRYQHIKGLSFFKQVVLVQAVIAAHAMTLCMRSEVRLVPIIEVR